MCSYLEWQLSAQRSSLIRRHCAVSKVVFSMFLPACQAQAPIHPRIFIRQHQPIDIARFPKSCPARFCQPAQALIHPRIFIRQHQPIDIARFPKSCPARFCQPARPRLLSTHSPPPSTLHNFQSRVQHVFASPQASVGAPTNRSRRLLVYNLLYVFNF
jgi:hypothetical protein